MTSLAAAEVAERLGVLVVDDDSHLLRTLSDILRRRGYEPSIATTGREGLAVAAQARPEPAIAIVDLALPDMNGLDLVHQLRQVSMLTEVVILTGNASLDSALGAMREQSYDYLIKPVPPDRLVSTLDRAGERWRRRHAEDALLKSEERLRVLVENISDIVLILDVHGRVTYASPAIGPALGYDPEALGGRPIAEVVHPQDAPLVTELFEAPSRGVVELRLRRRDGSWGVFSCRATNLLGQPAVSGLVLIAQDVTETRRLEIQAFQAQKLDSIGRLAGGVAHDFNNLLSVVLGYSDLALRHSVIDGDLRCLLESIHQAGERGAALTNQLLAFARRQPAAPRLVDPNALVRSLEGLLRRVLGEDVELVSDLDPEVGAIRADPAQLEQILMNLAINAREAMPLGGSLRLTTRRVHETPSENGLAPEAGDFLLLSVCDTGVGMNEEVQERLFEPFFTTKEMGTGLGLATTYGIVRQAGGEIAVASVPGEGSTVSIYLPIGDETLGETPEGPAPPDLPRGTETVLVVEDEPMVRKLVSQILETQGYEVLQAAGGAEALAQVEGAGAAPALLLTDLVMPGMGGEEIASRLGVALPDLRVLLMSGYSGSRIEPEAEGPRLLHKPFTPGALARAVRAALDEPVLTAGG